MATIATVRKDYSDVIRNTLKTAGGPTSERGYEQVLAKVGMSILQEQLPDAMQYFAGLSLLDKSEDGKFVAGFFVFNVNGTVVDVPMFVIDGKVKGHEMLFLRDAKLFLPAEPEVFEFILRQRGVRLGEEGPLTSTSRNRKTVMNVRPFSDQNRFMTKQSAIDILKSIVDDPWTSVLYDGTKKASLPAPRWVELLAHDSARAFVRAAAAHSPKFAAKMAAALGSDWNENLKKFELSLSQTLKTASKPSLDLSIVDSVLLHSQPQVQAPKVAAFKLAAQATRTDLSQAVAEIAKYGMCIEDYRDSAVSKIAMGVLDMTRSFMSPVFSGTYDVAMVDGSEKKLIVYRPEDIQPFSGSVTSCVVIDSGSGAVASVATAELAAKQGEKLLDPSEFKENLLSGEKLKLLSSIKPGDKCVPAIIVYPNGKISEPCRLERSEEGSVLNVRYLHLPTQGKLERMVHRSAARKNNEPNIDQVSIDTTGELTSNRIIKRPDADILRVPKDTKYYPLGYTSDEGSDYKDVKTLSVMPLTSLDLSSLAKKASFSVNRISSKHLDVNGKIVEQGDAVMSLMVSGLSKTAAMEIVDTVGGASKLFAIVDPGTTALDLASGVKQAYSLRDPDYSFAEPSSPADGQEGYHIPIHSEHRVNEEIPSNTIQFANQHQAPWSSEESPYTQPKVMDHREKAETEQMAEDPHYIFDNEMFTSMINHVNTSIERERLLSGLLKSCDTVGRARFLLLAHGEEFSESYGVDDADEMEEQLLTQLTGAGKLLVQLFNRSVSVGTDLRMTASADI